MGLVRRIIRLLHIRRTPMSEDELERALLKLREETGLRLAEARAEVACCAEEERRIALMLADEEQRVEAMLQRARQALAAELDELAWEAMREHLQAKGEAERLCDLWRRQHEGTQRLQALLVMLEEKYAEVEHRQRLLLAYQQLTRAHRALVAALSSEAEEGLIEHAEEALVTKEFITQAYRDLADSQYLEFSKVPETSITEQIHTALTHLRNEMGISPQSA